MRVGDTVLTYTIERELGEGGMGTVYLGRHSVLNQFVAIKVLSPLLARDQALRERFIQEANIQAGLRHPGIVQVLTADMESEQPSLVMEYIEGKSLSEVLELRGALPVDDAIKIMAQVLSAVGYAHQRGVIHRDLKPSNIMVMANGEAKVTDFGIAKVLGSTKLTRTGTAMGSAHYMSPEQIRRPESVDARSDIYSLGCVFYEVLAGRPPFGEKDASGTESEFEVKTAHVAEDVAPLSQIKPSIPESISAFVMRMLEKEPSNRPRNCEAALAELGVSDTQRPIPHSIARETSKLMPEPSAERIAQPSPSHKARSLKNDVGGLLAITALLVIFSVFIWTNTTPTFIQLEESMEADQLAAKIEAGNPNNLPSCPNNDGYKAKEPCWVINVEVDGAPNEKYTGEIAEARFVGYGTLTKEDGTRFVGTRNMAGLLEYLAVYSPNGALIAVGKTERGVSRVTLYNEDGKIYVGKLNDSGQYHGHGVLYNSDKSIEQSGIFENGTLVKSQKVSAKDIQGN
jgi:serine/threonine protein kinase